MFVESLVSKESVRSLEENPKSSPISLSKSVEISNLIMPDFIAFSRDHAAVALPSGTCRLKSPHPHP